MIPNQFGIDNHGINPEGAVHWNSSVPHLIEFALRRREGFMTARGALATLTGKRTGRSPISSASARNTANRVRVVSSGTDNQPESSPARLPRGTAFPGTYLPVNKPPASG